LAALEKKTFMTYRKVYGGTPVGTESRCDTCIYGRIIQGYAESERIVLCRATEPPVSVPFKVAECTTYEDKRLPCYWEMQKIAWDVRPKGSVTKTGFVLASDLKKAQTQEQETQTEEDEKPQEVPAAAVENE
jgi:hypothetical protein